MNTLTEDQSRAYMHKLLAAMAQAGTARRAGAPHLQASPKSGSFQSVSTFS